MASDKKTVILDTAVAMLRHCNDLKEVTTRAIAAEAGVNPALVNYYYGNKEKLISTAMKEIISGFLPEAPWEHGLGDPREALEKMLIGFMHNLMSLRKQLNKAIPSILLEDDITLSKRILPFIRAYADGRLSEQDMKMRAYHIMSFTLLVAYRCDAVKEYCGADLDDMMQCNHLIVRGLDLILSDL